MVVAATGAPPTVLKTVQADVGKMGCTVAGLAVILVPGFPCGAITRKKSAKQRIHAPSSAAGTLTSRSDCADLVFVRKQVYFRRGTIFGRGRDRCRGLGTRIQVSPRLLFNYDIALCTYVATAVSVSAAAGVVPAGPVTAKPLLAGTVPVMPVNVKRSE